MHRFCQSGCSSSNNISDTKVCIDTVRVLENELEGIKNWFSRPKKKKSLINNSNITDQEILPDFSETVVKPSNPITVRIIYNCVHTGMNMN